MPDRGAGQIRISEKRARFAVTVAYFVVCFGGLFYYAHGSYFCSRQGRTQHFIQTLRLAVGCTAWSLLVGVCGQVLGRRPRWRRLGPPVSALLAYLGFASITLWIYRGFGQFLFEGTWADVSCFFTEGYGSMFPIVVAPALALATFLGELVILKAGGLRSSGFGPS